MWDHGREIFFENVRIFCTLKDLLDPSFSKKKIVSPINGGGGGGGWPLYSLIATSGFVKRGQSEGAKLPSGESVEGGCAPPMVWRFFKGEGGGRANGNFCTLNAIINRGRLIVYRPIPYS